jgi:hypothetical protein
MSQRSDPSDIPDSTYPTLEKPDFKSQIPEHLTKDASDAEKYIMAQLSILTQFADWDVKAHMGTNEQVRKTNGRLLRAEANITVLREDKKFWKRGWGFIVTVVGVVGGLISFLILVIGALKGGS